MKAANSLVFEESPHDCGCPFCQILEFEAQILGPLLMRFDAQGHTLDGQVQPSFLSRLLALGDRAQALYSNCLLRLPQVHQRLLKAHSAGQLDTEAASIGISTPAAKRAVHRARQALMALMAADLSNLAEE